MSSEYSYFLNGAGPFCPDGNKSCPFCENENKIPVAINNSLIAEIKKIPMNIFQNDAGLMAYEFADMFQNDEKDDNVLNDIFNNFTYKDASCCSLDTLIKNQQSNEIIDGPQELGNNTTSSTADILNTLNQPHSNIDPSNIDPSNIDPSNIDPSNIDPSLVSYSMHLKQQTNETASYDIEPESGIKDTETCSHVGQMIQSIVEDYRKKFSVTELKEESKELDFSSIEKKALNICRRKDPYLKEIYSVIFGNPHITVPKEGSDKYYNLVQEYALLRATPQSTCDLSSCKNDYSPAKDPEQTQPINNITRVPATADSKVMDCKQPNFEDPAIISEDARYPIAAHQQQQPQLQQQAQQTVGAVYPALEASNVFIGSSQPNHVNSNAACSNSINPYQMPTSYLAYNSLCKKMKPRMTSKLSTPAQLPMFFAPHQYLMQAPQTPAYPTTPNYPQAMIQPQPNFANLQTTAPFYTASFMETHINTIIQQYQYQQYNVLAAAAAGNYEMLVYEQMLHQTQKIKTVVARNRLDKRLQLEMQKNATKMVNTNISPLTSVQSSDLTPAMSFKDDENVASGDAALNSFINQIGSNPGSAPLSAGNKQCPKGLSDPAIISAVDNESTCLNGHEEEEENLDSACEQLEEESNNLSNE